MSNRSRILAMILSAVMLVGEASPIVSMASEPQQVASDGTVAPHEHSYTEKVVKATCEEKGYTLHECECGDSYKDNYVEALGHSYYAVDTGKGTHYMVCRNDESHKYEEAHEWTYKNKVLPTCSEEGYSIYFCGKCGVEEKRDYVESLGHDYSWLDNQNGTHTGICSRNKNHVVTEYCKEFYKDVVTKPTCTEEGYTSHICGKCGSVLVDDYVQPLGHNYEYTNLGDGTHKGVCTRNPNHTTVEGHDMEQTVVEPTCTDRGYTEYTCKKCGYSFKDNFVAPVTHKWVYTSNDNGTHTAICEYNNAHSKVENCTFVEERVTPTCEEQGYDLHTCEKCGYSYKDNWVKAKGHEWVYTYNDNGTHTKKCKNDPDEVFTEKCNFVDEVIAPTCTENGYTLHTCSVCGASFKDNYVEKLGHDYSWSSLGDGTHVGTCSRNPKHTVREACDMEHIVTEPTCNTSGYTTHTCRLCGYTYIDSKVPALGHDYVYIDLGDGTHKRVCKNDPFEEEVIAPHLYTTVVVNPTCEAGGYVLHTCQMCGSSYKDNISPAKGHDYVYTAIDNSSHVGVCKNDPNHRVVIAHDNVNVVTPATCESDGYTTHTCKVCGHKFTDNVVPAIGHVWENVVTKPTCTTEGYTTHTCKVCGKKVIDTKVESLGHSYTWVIDKAAQPGIAGMKHQECSNCGHKLESVKIPALKVTEKLLPKVKSNSNTSQTLSWNKIAGAKYYKIYVAPCGKSYKYYKKVSGTSVKKSKLKRGTYYKYIVEAYTMDGDKEIKLAKSHSVHGVTKGNSSRRNPSKLKVNKSSVTVKVKKSSTLKSRVSDSRVQRHVSRIRYLSSNSSIASVSSSGKITGKKKGTCYIYIIQQDGYYKKVKVTIK